MFTIITLEILYLSQFNAFNFYKFDSFYFSIGSNVANSYVLSIVQIITNVQILSNSYVIWEFVDRKLNIFQVCLGLVYPISYALNNPCRNHLIVHLIVLWMIQQLINLSRCLSCCYCPVSRSTIETFNQNIIELRLRTLDFLLLLSENV